MNLTDEQRGRVAKVLGWEALSYHNHQWQVARSNAAGLAAGETLTEGQRIGSDWDLAGALLEWAGASRDPAPEVAARLRRLTESVWEALYKKTDAPLAIVLAVLQLPECQP